MLVLILVLYFAAKSTVEEVEPVEPKGADPSAYAQVFSFTICVLLLLSFAVKSSAGIETAILLLPNTAGEKLVKVTN